jgi:hypothetical protein
MSTHMLEERIGATLFYAEQVGTTFNEFVYCDFVLAKAYVQSDDPKY